MIWINDEARKTFEALQKMRDDLAASFAIDADILGRPEKLEHEMTSVEAHILRQRRHWTPERIAEQERAMRDAVEPYNRRLIELLRTFAQPRIMIEKANQD